MLIRIFGAAAATALSLISSVPAVHAQSAGLEPAYLSEVEYESLFDRWRSATDFIEGNVTGGNAVYGSNSEIIGEITDILFGSAGEALSVIAEVGGLWDIGDTHVAVPFDDIILDDPRDGIFGIIVPFDEESVENLGFFDDAESEIQELDENATVAPPAWRATELIGDLVRLDGRERPFGYVYDFFFDDAGRVQTVLVRPDAALKMRGLFGFPFGDGEWLAASDGRAHQLPYSLNDVQAAARDPAAGVAEDGG